MESLAVQIGLPDGTAQVLEINKRRTVDEVKSGSVPPVGFGSQVTVLSNAVIYTPEFIKNVSSDMMNMLRSLPGKFDFFRNLALPFVDTYPYQQIVLTRNYKIRGTRTDFFLVYKNEHVLVPEYKKFFEVHPDLAQAFAEKQVLDGVIKMVSRKDVEITTEGNVKKYAYKPRPGAPSPEHLLAESVSARDKRRSFAMEDDLERRRLESEAEKRRLKRMSSIRREEEKTQLLWAVEESKRMEEMEKRAMDDLRRRREERERLVAELRRKQKEEEENWQRMREERRKQREEERKKSSSDGKSPVHLLRSQTSSHLEVASPAQTVSRLSSSGIVTPYPSSSSSGDGTPRMPKSPRDDNALELLQETLVKCQRELKLKNEEVEELQRLLSKTETELQQSRQLADALQLRLERAERDVERAKTFAETRLQAADREIASLKTTLGRLKSVRDCVFGELQICNVKPNECANLIETRAVLERVQTRLDQALTGTNWRSTRVDFTSRLFSEEDLRDHMLKYPPKGVVAHLLLQDPAKEAQIVVEAPALDLSSVPSLPAQIDPTPRTDSTVEEVEKICNLPPDQEIDYWTILPDFGDLLGEGGYAEVFKGLYRSHPVAVKKFKVNYEALESGGQPMDTDLVRREIVILSKLSNPGHPNVMKFFGASVILPNICIVTELLCNGSLDIKLYNLKEVIDVDTRIRLAIEVAEGLNYLHTFNPIVIHRDIKSANVLLDENWTAKISDFGLAKFKRRAFEMPSTKDNPIPRPYTVIMNSSPVGTAAWCSPEILEHAPYNEKADIYSFGVLLWELWTRSCPYDNEPNETIIRATLEHKRLPIPEDCPPKYADLMRDCWVYDPWNRPSAEQIIQILKEIRAEMRR